MKPAGLQVLAAPIGLWLSLWAPGCSGRGAECYQQTDCRCGACENGACVGVAEVCDYRDNNCDGDTDEGCPGCGNGVIEAELGETCDGDCPESCDDTDPCTDDLISGSVDDCNVVCRQVAITRCLAGDGCCPEGCHGNNDGDCPSVCGNREVEDGETCDPPESCPISCDDSDPCIIGALSGSPVDCDVRCTWEEIFWCADDGCCPGSCSVSNDGDCEPLCPPTFHPCPSGCCPWDIQVVDAEGSVGFFPAVGVDSLGQIHIAYRSEVPPYHLKYARWNGNQWAFQTIDSGGNPGWDVSLALDDSNRPHIAYYDYTNDFQEKVKYARGDGSGWTIEVIDSYWMRVFPAIALDRSGTPHVSYGLSSKLMHAYRTDSGWVRETVDDAAGVGGYSSLAMDSSDNPHISYHGYTSGGLRYARWTGSIWDIDIVDANPEVGRYTSLMLDADDRPHISYQDFTRDDEKLMYARHDGSRWVLQAVDKNGNTGHYTSLVLGVDGLPRVSYHDATTFVLKYAYHTGTVWEILTVDDGSNVGRDCRLTLDLSGNPVIVYNDYSQYDLKLARW